MLVAVTGAFGQHEHSNDGEAIGWVPREILQRPVTLRDGIGKISDPVTSRSQEAQAFYNQGLAYLHSYVWIEATRSCNQALHSDPKLALAYICLSRAYSGLEDQTAAQAALQSAKSLAANLSEREQLRIALRAKQLEAINDIQNASKHEAYKKAIDEALTKYPEDSELWERRVGQTAVSTPTSNYALGSADGEHEWLIWQAARLAPCTEQLFREVGIAAGQRVLNLGSGVGDVAVLVAQLVRPSGQVMGVERDSRSIARAKARVAGAELHNVSFILCDASEIARDKPFDAVVGRFIECL